MRKLVTIRKISAKYQIEGADLIELVQVDGWQCIAKKGEFEVNDLCVYFEIDSFLPLEEKYSFLKKTTKFEGRDGYRIRSMKMRGVISQGLALPLSFGFKYDHINDPWTLDKEVTEVLGVVKYDNAQSNYDQKVGNSSDRSNKFPSFIPKTDQERVQNLTSYFTSMKGHAFEESLKLDGSSMTCYKVKDPKWYDKLLFWLEPSTKFGVCSRNLEVEMESAFGKAAIKYNIEKQLPVGYAVQGELVAPKIQTNHEKVSEAEFYVFDIYNITEQRYLTPTERYKMMDTTLSGLLHTPIVEKSIKVFDVYDLQSLLKRVEGQSMNPGTISEGRVYKSLTNPNTTFKAISNKYLLKSEK